MIWDKIWWAPVWYALLALFAELILRGLKRRLHAKEHGGYQKAFHASLLPLRVLLLLALGYGWLAQWVAWLAHGVEFLSSLGDVVPLVLRLWGMWWAWRLLNVLEHWLWESKVEGLDKTTATAITHALRIVVIGALVLITLPLFGVSTSGILAVGGAGTLIAGLAGREMLANFFGGLTIYLDSPFKIGDWIRSPDRDIEGMVEYIGFRATRVRTFDKRVRYIPNAIFSSIILENPSRMSHRRFQHRLGVRYQDEPLIGEISRRLLEFLKQHPEIDQTERVSVTLVHLADASLELGIDAFTKLTGFVPYLVLQQELLLKMMQIVKAAGADFAYPTQELYLRRIEENIDE